MKYRPLEERFFAKVNKQGPVPEHAPRLGSCWRWTGRLEHKRLRYGTIMVRGRRQRAHRVSWELANGPVPHGLGVLHKCDAPECVNPRHLFLGTQTDNNRDMFAKGRNAKRLPDSVVAAIVDDRASGHTQRAVARKYGVSPSHVWRLFHGVQRRGALASEKSYAA